MQLNRVVTWMKANSTAKEKPAIKTIQELVNTKLSSPKNNLAICFFINKTLGKSESYCKFFDSSGSSFAVVPYFYHRNHLWVVKYHK